jgi:hypothetical protein
MVWFSTAPEGSKGPPPPFAGRRHAQMKLAAMAIIPVAAMILIELYRSLFRLIEQVDHV